MGKGSNVTTQNKSYTPAAMGSYQNVMNRAMGVASTPYQAYTGELTAGVNPYQERAFGAIDNAAGFASPYIQEASGFARGAAQPISSGDIGQYMDPYTQMVVDATRKQFETQNARDQSALVGNAAAKGALGGDRVSVAQGTLAGEKARAQDPVIAGLYSQGYQGALAAAQAQKSREAQTAGQIAGFGTAGAQAGLAGGSAMLQAGTLQQQTEQQRLSALYGQYQQAQAYPYQQLQWLADITSGVGSQMGGTTTGTMEKPSPSPWSTVAGLGAIGASFIPGIGPAAAAGLGSAGAGLMRAHGGAVDEPIRGFAGGGVPTMPWGNAQGFIPKVQMRPGNTVPELDKWPEQKEQGFDFSKLGQLGAASQKSAPAATPGGSGFVHDWNRIQFGDGAARGGGVFAPGGFAEGGTPFDDRYDMTFPTLAASRGLVPSEPLADAPRSYSPALDKAVRDFSERYNFAPPKQRVEEGWDEARKATLGGEDAPWQSWTRGPSDTPGIPQFDVAGKPVATPENVPLPPRRAVAGVAPPADNVSAVRAGPPVPMAEEDPYQAPPEYRAPTAFRPSGEGAPGVAPAAGGKWLFDDPTRQALMAAGFGMLASRSPHPGVAIGEGGLTGMSAYAGARGAERAQEEARLTRAEQAKRLDLDADKLAETARHHRDTLAEQVRHRKMEELKPIVIHEEKDRYGTVIRKIMGVRDRDSGGYRILNPDGSLGQVVQPGQVPAQTPAPTGTPNTTAAPRVASEEEQGIIPRHATLVSSGHDYSTGNAPLVERGMEVPTPLSVGDASPDTIKAAAERYLLDGTIGKTPYGNSPVAKAERAVIMSVKNYAHSLAKARGIELADLAELQRNAKGYLGWVTGVNGRTAGSLGTAIRHLDTMQQLADAWQKGTFMADIPVMNRLRAFVTTQFGGNAATDMRTAASIIGPEIIKAIGVAGAGTQAERLAQEAFLDPTRSADQIKGSIKSLTELLGGQLKTKKEQGAMLGVDEARFKRLVGERPYEILMGAAGEHGGGGAKSGAGAGTKDDPIAVKSKADMEKLAPGTWYRTPSGKAFPR